MWHIDIKDTTIQYLNVYLQEGKLSPSCDFWSAKEFRLIHVSPLNFILFLSCYFYAHHWRWEKGSNIKRTCDLFFLWDGKKLHHRSFIFCLLVFMWLFDFYIYLIGGRSLWRFLIDFMMNFVFCVDIKFRFIKFMT